jgi:hypothetical protein
VPQKLKIKVFRSNIDSKRWKEVESFTGKMKKKM